MRVAGHKWLETRMDIGCRGFAVLLGLDECGYGGREVAERIPKKFPSMEGYAAGGGWSGRLFGRGCIVAGGVC